VRRNDDLTASKVAVAISARAAFGDDFAYRTAWSAGLPANLITSIFSRPIHETREFQLPLKRSGDRRKEPR